MNVTALELPASVELREGEELSIQIQQRSGAREHELSGSKQHTILLREIAVAELDTFTTLQSDERSDSPSVAAFIKQKFAGLSETPLVFLYFRPDAYSVQQVSMFSEGDGLKLLESILLEPEQFEGISTGQRQIIGALTPLNTLE